MITLSDKAAREVKRIIEEMAEGDKYLRVAVRGGGCSGFSWALNLDNVFDDKKDVLEEHHGIKIAIDKKSALYLEGTSIDFLEDLNRRGFVFGGSQVKSTCGCGSSFQM